MDYIKAIFAVLAAVAALRFGLPLVAIPPSTWQGQASPNIAWYGDAFLEGESPILEARHVHNLCFAQAEAGSDYRRRQFNPRSTIYIRCWGRELLARPQYLCDEAMKRHYLRLLADFKREIDGFKAQQANIEEVYNGESGAAPAAFARLAARLESSTAHGASGIEAADLETPDLAVVVMSDVSALAHSGLIDPLKELAALFDASQLIEIPSPQEIAAAREATCP